VKVTDGNGRSFRRTLTLNVLAMYGLTVTSTPPEGGSVTRTPSQPLYVQGSLVEIAAMPNTGYVFLGWNGETLSTDSPLNVLMTENKSIAASFAMSASLPDYTVASATFPASAAAGEIIAGGVSITVRNAGAGAANPAPISAGIYLSTDAMVTPEDILLWKGRVLFTPPASGEAQPLPIDPGLRIPTTIAPGAYTIGVVVDDTNAVVERNDGNNASSSPIVISTSGYGHLEVLGGWPYGTSTAVAGDGPRHLIVRGNGAVLEIVDISTPSQPAILSRLNLGPSVINAVKIVGSLAYVGGRRFSVVDISDPRDPRVVGSCAGIQSQVRDFDISGTLAFVSDYHYGLRVVDVSNPTAPVAVGFVPYDSRTRLVRAFGTTAYVQRSFHIGSPSGTRGLSIVDASDPGHPVERSSLNLNVSDLALDKTGRYLYLGLAGNGIHIYDVLNPDAPQEVAAYQGVQNASGILVVEDRAFVADQGQNRIVVLDITTATDPQEISSYPFQDATSLVRPGVAGDLCLVPSWYDSLRIVDFSDPGAPRQVGSLEYAGLNNYADVQAGYAFVATNRMNSNLLRVLNLANLPDVTETASQDTPYYVNDVVTNGIYAYLAGQGAGLRTFRISDPAHPIEVNENWDAWQPLDIVVSGHYAYVADSWNGLRIFDIQDPAIPVLVGSCPTPASAQQLAVSGGYAFLACEWSGMRVVDVSDPAHPREVGRYEPGGWIYNVNVWGHYAYVNDNYDILHIVDVSSPVNPVERAALDLYYCYGDIGFSGHYMFVPNTFFGLKVVDIADPANPVEVEVDRDVGDVCDVVVREDRVYILDRDSGFYALEFVNPLFGETFESSAVGTVPSGWSVAAPGETIAVSDARSYRGSRSLNMRGAPFGGSNLVKPISDLNISSGLYRLTFRMSADTDNWAGTDGYAIGHLEVGGKAYAMGIKKNAGAYELCMYGVVEKTLAFPGDPGAWNKYEVLIDLNSQSAGFYLNGAYLEAHAAADSSAPDRVHLSAGASGAGGGHPTVYYDDVTIERIR